MLKSPLFWKMTTLFGAVLLLLIPIMLIRQVIVERADYRSDVEDEVPAGRKNSLDRSSLFL